MSGGQDSSKENVRMWIAPIVLLAGIVGTGSVSQYQISENKDHIKDLQQGKETTIRLEVRQIQIKEDVKETKEDIKEIKEILRNMQR